jgi:dienelactone hydrolase
MVMVFCSGKKEVVMICDGSRVKALVCFYGRN